ncbi:phage tail assembly chaperone [Entomohabitans teleogrylli]|uniref:phage tail assembly chaperone n=1 Tax=Entomohabitans teleogrylli TaxID=1384589 RepID=UPI00073D74BB|nr:hypothetical protein [Entomohabitans teleogrylli]
MQNEFKEIAIGGHTFMLIQLDPWRRLAFIADLQKEFLVPLLKSGNENDLDKLKNNDIDMLAILSGFSAALDSHTLEKWTRRILSDGLIVYDREDGQRAKLSFSELNKFFTQPTDILLLLKEAVLFNIADFSQLLSSFNRQGTQPGKVSEG